MSQQRTQWGDVPQAAEILGVSTKTVRRWISAGRIDARRFGPRLIRVNLTSLDDAGRPLQYRGGAAA